MTAGDHSPIWGSVLTRELVDGWTDEQVADLVADLDRAVMLTIQDHEARRADG